MNSKTWGSIYSCINEHLWFPIRVSAERHILPYPFKVSEVLIIKSSRVDCWKQNNVEGLKLKSRLIIQRRNIRGHIWACKWFKSGACYYGTVCVSVYICWCLSALLCVSQWRNSRSAIQKTFVWLCSNLGTGSFHSHFTAFCGFSDPVGWLYSFAWTHLCKNKHKTHTRCTATGAIGWRSVTCFKLFLVWFCSVSPPHVETMLGSTKHPFCCYGLMRSRKLEGFDSSFWWLL